jgi:uridine kinase
MNGDSEEQIRKIIREKFGDVYDMKNKYLIVIQGATSSGKSTVAKEINRLLTDKGIPSKLIGLDSYYLSPDNPLEEDDNYDFDNPASLDWESIVELLTALKNDEKNLPVYFRRKSKSEINTKEFCVNTFPSVIIVEGIYAFNIINRYIFNLDELDPTDSKKKLSQEFVESDYNFDGYKILKIFLPLCKNKLWAIRKARDLKLKKPYDAIKSRFEKMIWPDTQRWVYSTLEYNDIQVAHGNFNETASHLLVKNILGYFCLENMTYERQLEDDLSEEFKVECSGECKELKMSHLILKDD